MINSKQDPKISETLEVIRKALEDEGQINEIKDNVLLLTKIVKEDGTLKNISQKNQKENPINKDDIINIIDSKIEKVIEKHIKKWINKNMPNIINKTFKEK